MSDDINSPPPPPPQPDAPPAPPQPDPMQQTLQHIEALQNRLQQTEQMMASQYRQPEAPPEPEEYIDPAVEKRMSARERAMLAEVESVRERLDYSEYQSKVRDLGLDPETQKTIDGLYANWQQRGVTIQGKPPSRLDALHYGLGVVAAQNTHKTRQQKQMEEMARQREQLSGFAERSGSGRRAAPGMDPDKMSRQERLEKYYPAVLDEGF